MATLATTVKPMGANARRFNLRRQDTIVGWLLIAPSLIIILGVTLQPVLSTLYLSFFDASTSVNLPRTFIGLDNYTNLLQDPVFWQTIGRTMYFMVTSVGLELIVGIGIAQLIHTRPPGWKFLRISLIIPWAVPTIVNGAMWGWIYNGDYGALNGLLYQLGVINKYIPWLIDPARAMNLVILADIWHTVPFVALIIQAALAGLPAELDEAAAVDGASAWDRFWQIRLPLLRPAILVALIIRSVEAFRVFDIVYVITHGGPAFGTVTISYLTYQETFSYGHLGRGAALSFLVSIFTLGIAFIYIRYVYRPGEGA
ncbi:MAG TPA: sugar ABC transporter permease [Aggregatilineales bacterium]|nr:sugar ABC transporter permease [Aggregatilineales bacterium]